MCEIAMARNCDIHDMPISFSGWITHFGHSIVTITQAPDTTVAKATSTQASATHATAGTGEQTCRIGNPDGAAAMHVGFWSTVDKRTMIT